MKKLVYIVFLLFPFVSLFSQDDKEAAKIIDDFISLVQNKTVQADFILNILNENDQPIQTQNGKFTMKGNKFRFNLEGGEVYYDGKTQWSYMSVANEVSITEPTEKELAEIHPLIVLTEYRKDYAVLFSKKEAPANKYLIDMVSMIPADDFEEMEIVVDKTTKMIESMRIWGTAFNMTVQFNKFQSGISVDDSYFIFDKSNYKGVILNDLR